MDIVPVNVPTVLLDLECAIGEYVVRKGRDACDRVVVVMNEWVFNCVWADKEETVRAHFERQGERYVPHQFPDMLVLHGVRVVPADCEGVFEITEETTET